MGNHLTKLTEPCKIKKNLNFIGVFAMIKNNEIMKQEIMDDISKRIDKYFEDMDNSSNEEKFPIDKIERMLGAVIHDSKQIIVDKTAELLANINEEDEIVKKN